MWDRYTDYLGYWGGLASHDRSGGTTFYGFDPQGSTRILVSIAGVVTDSYSFKAFGEKLAASGATLNPLRYEGQYGYYRDLDTRLYVRAREYDPTVGRWVSRDPLGYGGGDWNLYVYGRSQPISGVDPSGMLLEKGCDKSPGSWKVAQTVCNCITHMTAQDWAAVRACYAALLKRFPGTGCPPLGPTFPGCAQQFCNQGQIVCCDPGDCDCCGSIQEGPRACACLEPQPLCVPSVYLCLPYGQTHKCDLKGFPMPPGCSPTAWNMVHEIGHLCGVAHGKDSKVGCNDFLARCVYSQCLKDGAGLPPC